MKKLLAIALLAASSPAIAATNFTGTTVSASLLFPNTSTTYAPNTGPATATVSGETEFPVGTFSPAFGSIDVGANFFTFFTNQSAQYSTADFNGFRLDFARPILSASLAAGNTFSGGTVTFSGNSVFLNVSGLNAVDGQFATVNVSAVPEPATWAMMIGGFGMVGGAMRSARRKQKLTVSFG
jgi:hypothetical protein